MFTLSTDPARSLTRITLTGRWADADLARFETALPPALAETARFAGPTLCLIDARALPAQPRIVADRLARLFATTRLADYVAAIARDAEARRIVAARAQRTFDNPDQALAWLVAVRAGAMPMAA